MSGEDGPFAGVGAALAYLRRQRGHTEESLGQSFDPPIAGSGVHKIEAGPGNPNARNINRHLVALGYDAYDLAAAIDVIAGHEPRIVGATSDLRDIQIASLQAEVLKWMKLSEVGRRELERRRESSAQSEINRALGAQLDPETIARILHHLQKIQEAEDGHSTCES